MDSRFEGIFLFGRSIAALTVLKIRVRAASSSAFTSSSQDVGSSGGYAMICRVKKPGVLYCHVRFRVIVLFEVFGFKGI